MREISDYHNNVIMHICGACEKTKTGQEQRLARNAPFFLHCRNIMRCHNLLSNAKCFTCFPSPCSLRKMCENFPSCCRCADDAICTKNREQENKTNNCHTTAVTDVAVAIAAVITELHSTVTQTSTIAIACNSGGNDDVAQISE